jgi:hypothetical protein
MARTGIFFVRKNGVDSERDGMRTIFGFIKATVLWHYERGSWQYDVLCVLILAFIFLIPPGVFDERKSSQKNAPLRMDEATRPEFFSVNDLSNASPSGTVAGLLESAGRDRLKRPVRVRHFEVVTDITGKHVVGYNTWFE